MHSKNFSRLLHVVITIRPLLRGCRSKKSLLPPGFDPETQGSKPFVITAFTTEALDSGVSRTLISAVLVLCSSVELRALEYLGMSEWTLARELESRVLPLHHAN